MSRPDLIGTVLAGRYKIMGVIGEGGMGSVYLGEQIAMGRKTAIKVLHADADDAGAIARFRRGSRNAAGIDHPNVCRIFEYGDPPGGLHFLAMEFIEGESVHDLMTRKGPIPLPRAIRIITQTVAALHAAHGLGIVHRDLKPGNIMLTRGADGEELVKVVDFDIAKAPSDTENEEITQLDWLVGTPVYMSPEQFMAKPVDPRSDIYSLGIVLFRMISGSVPFSGDNPWSIMAQRISTPPLTLSEVAPETEFPPELQKVIDRALQQDPDERWQSVVMFGEALLAAVGPAAEEGEPGESSGRGSPETKLWQGPWETALPLEEPTHAAAESEIERFEPTDATAATELVDLQIPATQVAPSPPPSTPAEERPNEAPEPFASRWLRPTMAVAATMVLATGAWGAFTTFGGGADRGPEPAPESLAPTEPAGGANVPVGVVNAADSVMERTETANGVPSAPIEVPELVVGGEANESGTQREDTGDGAPVNAPEAADTADVTVGVTVEDDTSGASARLSALQADLDSYLGSVVPDAVAYAADSVAAIIFEESDGIAELQARAAYVRAQAMGFLDDWGEALVWARRAVDLDPENRQYQLLLRIVRSNLGRNQEGSP